VSDPEENGLLSSSLDIWTQGRQFVSKLGRVHALSPFPLSLSPSSPSLPSLFPSPPIRSLSLPSFPNYPRSLSPSTPPNPARSSGGAVRSPGRWRIYCTLNSKMTVGVNDVLSLWCAGKCFKRKHINRFLLNLVGSSNGMDPTGLKVVVSGPQVRAEIDASVWTEHGNEMSLAWKVTMSNNV